MLAGCTLTQQFMGGTIYQFNLSSLKYYRGHSLITGTVVQVYLLPRAYYPERLAEGFEVTRPNQSLASNQHTSRHLHQAENPGIGLRCFLNVGMCESGSYNSRVYEVKAYRKVVSYICSILEDLHAVLNPGLRLRSISTCMKKRLGSRQRTFPFTVQLLRY